MRELAFTLALTMVAPLSAYAATASFSSSSAGAGANGYGFINSCEQATVNINVSQNGARNLSAPSTTGFAYATVFVYNYCPPAYFAYAFEYGSTSTFEFDAPGAPNVLPNSVQASGSIPLSCFNIVGTVCPSSSDTLTFSMNLQPIGTASFEQATTMRTSYSGMVVDQHIDGNFAFATTGSVTVSSQNFGALPVPNGSAAISDQKVHTVTINH
jgi:hypothetical protein